MGCQMFGLLLLHFWVEHSALASTALPFYLYFDGLSYATD